MQLAATTAFFQRTRGMRHHRPWCLLLGILIGIGIMDSARAATTQPASIAPLAYRNQHPLYLTIPNLLPMSAQSLPRGSGSFQFSTSYSNIFEQFITLDYDVLFDMEVARTALHYAQGLGRDFTIELDIPFIYSYGGFLDPFISGFHQALKLPDAGRGNFPDNQFAYRIINQRTGADQLRAQATKFGLGDVDLTLRHQLLREGRAQPAFSWFGLLELPTGRRSRGLGNGELDYGLGLLAEKQLGRWGLQLQTGYFVGAPLPGLETLMHAEHVSFLAGLAYRLSRPLALHAQFHSGTPLLKGMGNSRWDDIPLDIIVGISGQHPKALGGQEAITWQLGFSEDLHANGPSIDFTALLQFGIRWDAL